MLRDEIAAIISGAAYPGPRSFRKADAVLALLRKRAEKKYECVYDSALFDSDDEGAAAWCKRTKPHLGHEACGPVWLLDLGEP